MKLIRPLITMVVAFLVGTSMTIATAPPAQAASSLCQLANPTGPPGQYFFRIYFQYRSQSGNAAVCGYTDKTAWTTAIRDAVVRGEHGASYGGSDYASISIGDYFYTQFTAVFHGAGPSGYVTTSQNPQLVSSTADDEAISHGWRSSVRKTCAGQFVPSTSSDTERYVLADFVYHVGEVAKTNSRDYPSNQPRVNAAQITWERDGGSTKSEYYSPTSCPLH